MSISSILFHIMTFSLSNYRAIYIRLRDPFDKKNLSISPPSSTAQQPPQTTQQQACYQQLDFATIKAFLLDSVFFQQWLSEA